MSDNMQLVTRVNEFQSIARTFVESRMFKDVESQAQAFVKIMAGAEMNIPPFTAMNSFHIIQGKACMSANAIAARVKGSGRYNYRVVEKSATRCVIEFTERGVSEKYVETWDEARARKMGVKNMDKMPEAMLFARCITSGARAFCPDVVGQYYTAEEMGADVDENGEIIDAAPRVVQTQPAPDPVVAAAAQNGGVVRQAQPDPLATVRATLERTKAALAAGTGYPAIADAMKRYGQLRDIATGDSRIDGEVITLTTLDAKPHVTAVMHAIKALCEAIIAANEAQSVPPAAGEQAEMIPQSPLEAMPA